MRNRAIVVAALLFLAPLPQSVQGQQPVNQEVFKGQGTNANTFVSGVGINGIGTAMFLDVFQDSRTGDTFLLLRVIAHPERGSNGTTYFLFGAIPTADFVIDPDLRFATLNMGAPLGK
jgi:hypothetical protein